MADLLQLLQRCIDVLRNPGELIVWGGYPALAAIIFAETGALAFFLPGDSLLLVAGFYAAKGDLNLAALNGLLIPLAILGDTTSYALGRRAGPALFARPRSRFFRPEYLQAASDFYQAHGGRAIILARFIPIVRTFVPVIAGMAAMGYRKFVAFNVIGAAAWVGSMTLTGYFLGWRFPVLLEHTEKVIVGVILLSLVPPLLEVLKARRAAKRP